MEQGQQVATGLYLPSVIARRFSGLSECGNRFHRQEQACGVLPEWEKAVLEIELHGRVILHIHNRGRGANLPREKKDAFQGINEEISADAGKLQIPCETSDESRGRQRISRAFFWYSSGTPAAKPARSSSGATLSIWAVVIRVAGSDWWPSLRTVLLKRIGAVVGFTIGG